MADEMKTIPAQNPASVPELLAALRPGESDAWSEYWTDFYQAVLAHLQVRLRPDEVWGEARAWFETIPFIPAYSFLWKMFLHEEDEMLKTFAALYLVKMRSAPEYRPRRSKPLTLELDPELARRQAPVLYEEAVRADDRPTAEPSPLAAEAARVKDFQPLPPSSLNLATTGRALRSALLSFEALLPRDGESVEAALALDQNLAGELPTVVSGLKRHSSRRLRLHILLRGLDAAYAGKIAALFPEMSFRFYFCDQVNFGDGVNLLSYTTASTLDRLLLPALLPESDQILYLDLDTLAVDRIDELFELDLGMKLIAARREAYERMENGRFRACDRQYDILNRFHPPTAQDRQEGRRTLLGLFGSLDRPYYNAGVLLMNLAEWRRRGTDRLAAALVERFGFHDQDAINLAVGDCALELDHDWNLMHTISFSRTPKIIHWAHIFKPWKKYYVPWQELWLKTAAEAGTGS